MSGRGRGAVAVAAGAALISLAAVIAAVTGCERSVESKLGKPIDAPPPRHPAMASIPRSTRSTGGDPHSHGALPAGHPPIPRGAQGQPSTGADAVSLPAPEVDAGGRLRLAGVSFALPAGWRNEPRSSSMRLAQFALPRADSDAEDGLMTVSTVGGGVQRNIERWRTEQFVGSPPADVETRTVGGLRVTTVWIEGTYKGMSGPFAGGGGEPKEGFALLGAVVENPADATASQQLFFKGTGPLATMSRWRGAFEDLLASLRAE